MQIAVSAWIELNRPKRAGSGSRKSEKVNTLLFLWDSFWTLQDIGMLQRATCFALSAPQDSAATKNNSGAMAWKRQCGSEAVMPVQPVGQLLPPPPSPSPPPPPPPPTSYADNTPPTWHSFYNWTSLGLDKVILCAFSDLFHQAGQGRPCLLDS